MKASASRLQWPATGRIATNSGNGFEITQYGNPEDVRHVSINAHVLCMRMIPTADFTRKTVLVVEDDGGLRKLLRLILESTGINVIAADCAAAAVEQDLTVCHAVFLDIHLPDARGEDVAEQLRTTGYAGPIVALTADARLVERGVLAGDVGGPFDGWVDKAVPPDQLLKKMREYLGEDDSK